MSNFVLDSALVPKAIARPKRRNITKHNVSSSSLRWDLSSLSEQFLFSLLCSLRPVQQFLSAFVVGIRGCFTEAINRSRINPGIQECSALANEGCGGFARNAGRNRRGNHRPNCRGNHPDSIGHTGRSEEHTSEL